MHDVPTIRRFHNTGEPDAMKVARPVRRGTAGKVPAPAGNSPAVYPTQNVRQALRVADAMSPAVLFVDELEKALSGVGGQGDSGVATRMFGTLLTWLSDHTSDVFFIGTSNDISKLPPEFTRAERFDGVFFLDFPGNAERDVI